jgi:hypothetical protein
MLGAKTSSFTISAMLKIVLGLLPFVCFGLLPSTTLAFVDSSHRNRIHSPLSPVCFRPRHALCIPLSATLIPNEASRRRDGEDELGNVQIPSTGISVSDEMEWADKDRFETELVPITGLSKVAAQIVTTASSRASFEPVRYLVSLSPQPPEESRENQGDDSKAADHPDKMPTAERSFVLVDIPPFSPSLVAKIKDFIGATGHLAAMLVTSRDGIHYDDAPAVYRLRRSDLEYWKRAFPAMAIIGYRMDIPRDCRESTTQILDGYGPFALQEDDPKNVSFVETGRPLTSDKPWDHDEAEDYLRGKKAINETKYDNVAKDASYTPESIRSREENKRILAVYTPGFSFGSVSYVFPEIGLCCSGFTIPVEDTRDEENPYLDSAGPALDCRGYITTNRGGIQKQMESARHLVRTYGDRFHTVLASRGDPLMLPQDDPEYRRKYLLDVLKQYEKIGKIYEELGIFDDEDE